MNQDLKRRLIWAVAGFAVLTLLAAAIWLGRAPYRHFKERREAAQAQTFLASGDYRNALLSARLALVLNPTNIPACRVMAALAELSHSPMVLDFRRRIAQTEPSIENKLQLALAALQFQRPPFPLAQQILDELAPAATNLASYQVAAATLAISLHRLDQAEAHFVVAARLDPTNQFYQLNLAVLRLASTNTTAAAPARAALENLRTDSNLGAPALRALMVDRFTRHDWAAANHYSTQLLAAAQANLADQLQYLGILQQLKSGDFSARLQKVKSQTATNAAAAAQVAAWMQANELLADEMFWLTNLPVTMQSQPPVRLALADAYLQSADWRALRDFVAKDNWSEMEFMRLALAARAWSQLGVQAVAESNWSAAVNEAGNRYGALTALLGLAEKWKLPREREDLLRRIVEKFPREPWALHALEPLYLAEGNTLGLNQVYAKSFSFFTNDIGLKNNLAFTSLLLKTNLPKAYEWAAEVYAGKTNDAVTASTYALALHLQGRSQDGIAVLQKLDPRSLQEPDTALYYAILLAASGDTNAAAPFLKIARAKTDWLPEEKILFSNAAGKF